MLEKLLNEYVFSCSFVYAYLWHLRLLNRSAVCRYCSFHCIRALPMFCRSPLAKHIKMEPCSLLSKQMKWRSILKARRKWNWIKRMGRQRKGAPSSNIMSRSFELYTSVGFQVNMLLFVHSEYILQSFKWEKS